MKIHSLNFSTLKGHYELYLSAMKGTKDLSYFQREMIAVVVSNVNRCHYWIIHHGAGLRKIKNDDEFIKQFFKDFKTSPISDQDKKMLDYAVKLSLEPWNMGEADVQELRDAGISNTGILDIAHVTGY